MDDERYCFLVEWYEELAARTRQFQLFYYVNSQAVEMYDLKSRKLFLRTSVKENNITLTNLFVTNSVNICGRLLTIVDYGDEYTRRSLTSKKERTYAMIKPDSVDKLGHILDIIQQKGFLIGHFRMCYVDRQQALNFYKEHSSKPFLNSLLDYITSGPVVAMELVGEGAIGAWRDTIGPTCPSEARKVAPSSIRARYGQDKIFNAVHGSKDVESAASEIEFFFPSSSKSVLESTCKASGNCTCCVIRPSAIKAGLSGKIIMAITDAGFKIQTAQLFNLEKANAEEFLEVYKGVVHEYAGMVTELTSGPCLALEVVPARPTDVPVTLAFRELCGPSDPEIARQLRPRTVRAMFGTDKVKNAVHCTDLPDDGQLEVEYFFRILDR